MKSLKIVVVLLLAFGSFGVLATEEGMEESGQKAVAVSDDVTVFTVGEEVAPMDEADFPVGGACYEKTAAVEDGDTAPPACDAESDCADGESCVDGVCLVWGGSWRTLAANAFACNGLGMCWCLQPERCYAGAVCGALLCTETDWCFSTIFASKALCVAGCFATCGANCPPIGCTAGWCNC